MDVNQLQLSSVVLLYDGSYYDRIYRTELMQESAAAARLYSGQFRSLVELSQEQSIGIVLHMSELRRPLQFQCTRTLSQ